MGIAKNKDSGIWYWCFSGRLGSGLELCFCLEKGLERRCEPRGLQTQDLTLIPHLVQRWRGSALRRGDVDSSCLSECLRRLLLCGLQHLQEQLFIVR